MIKQEQIIISFLVFHTSQKMRLLTVLLGPPRGWPALGEAHSAMPTFSHELKPTLISGLKYCSCFVIFFLFIGINFEAKWFQLFKTLTQKINRRHFALWILLEDNRSNFGFSFFKGKWIVKPFCLIFKSFKMYVCLVRLRSTAFFSWFRSSRHTIWSAQALLRSVTRFNCVTQNVNWCGLGFNLPLPWAIHHKTQLVSNKLSIYRRHSLSLNHFLYSPLIVHFVKLYLYYTSCGSSTRTSTVVAKSILRNVALKTLTG